MATYLTDFGDGSYSREKNPTHTYNTPGVYTVTRTVTNLGVSDTTTLTITVTDKTQRELALSDIDTRKCFHYGVNTFVHGAGWSEVSDGDWVWPEEVNSVVSLFDDNNQSVQVVWDSDDGLPYIIDPRKAPSATKLGEAWVDKRDLNNSDKGTEIVGKVYFAPDTSEEKRYTLKHLETRVFFRPIDSFRDAFAVDFAIIADDESSEEGRAEDVPYNQELFIGRAGEGYDLEIRIEPETSKYRIERRESLYASYNKPAYMTGSDYSETTWSEALQSPIVWLTRGDHLLKNRYNNSTLSGTVTATDGADGKQDSAMVVSSPIDLGNSIITGTLMFWTTDESIDPGSLGCATFSDSITVSGTTWYLRYFYGTIGANLELPAGTYFDVRLYGGLISSGATESAMKFYYDNIKNHQGDMVLPAWGIDI